MNAGNILYTRVLKLFFCLFIFTSQGAQNTCAQQEQRYNRFQYHKYNWQQYNGKGFHIYFAKGSDSLYNYLKEETAFAIKKIKKNMITDISQEVNIIVYPSVDQLYESNIGSFETQQFTLPTFVSKASRIVLAYNGSYTDLKQQLYESLARAQWETQLKEGGLEDQAKGTNANQTQSPSKSATSQIKSNSTDIPMWFKEGAIRYLAEQWPIAAEDKLRQSFEQQHFTSWPQVLNYEPRLGGQAFCYFLTEKYFPTITAQLFLQLRKKRSLPRVVRLITKHSLDSLYTQCYTYYAQRFNVPPVPNAIHNVIPHKKGIIKNVLVSPDEQQVLYTINTYNQRTVYLYDLHTGQTKKILRYLLAPWIDDHNADQYPLLNWNPDGKKIYIALPVKRKITIHTYDGHGTYIETTKLDGIAGLTAMESLNDRDFLLTAYTKGQSDIVKYNDNGGTYTAYTDDTYDDASGVFTGKGNAGNLLFISNRPKENRPKQRIFGGTTKPDTLWQGIYKLEGKEIVPVKIDTTPYIKWDKIIRLQNGSILVTNTKYGTEKNELVNHINETETQLGNYTLYQYLPVSDNLYFYTAAKDSIYLTHQPLYEWVANNKTIQADTAAWLKDYKKRAARIAREDSLLRAAKDTAHYAIDDILKAAAVNPADNKKQKKQKITGTPPKEVNPYVLQLHSAYFTAQVNNDYFMNRYQPYLNCLGQYKFPEIGGMAQGGFTDLFENHRFTIAYRLPAATQGSDFFVNYEYAGKKLDWGLTYYRKVDQLQPDPQSNWVDDNGNLYPSTAKVKTHYYELALHNPITYDCSLGLSTAIRKDKTIFLATDKYSLDFAPIESMWSITSLSFKLNKLQPTIPYLYKGFKITAFIDGFQGFTQHDAALFGSSINAAYHQPLYKYITVVAQAHAGYSGGMEKVLYNLGGEDNNVTPKVDTTVHFLQTAPYAFQGLVTPFRGYFQNSLYGNQYLLFNTDVYFPVFQTLYPLQTPLPSINNLQLGLLSDVATAKETWNNSNPDNNKWIWSYGMSVRTTLAGYPLRVDVAWPGSFSKKPVWYFTLNLQ